MTQNQGRLWTIEELTDVRRAVEAEGLTLAAIENLDPSHWHDVLLDGPRKREQLEDVKTIVRNLGAAGIPVLGYNFSIAGVWGHVASQAGRHERERPVLGRGPHASVRAGTRRDHARPGRPRPRRGAAAGPPGSLHDPRRARCGVGRIAPSIEPVPRLRRGSIACHRDRSSAIVTRWEVLRRPSVPAPDPAAALGRSVRARRAGPA